MIGLYLHIPFCRAICSYCNFNRGLFDAALKVRYVDAIEREILDAADGQPADTIFFGGGTPSLLEPAEVGRLIAACRSAYDVSPGAEITLETNPETSSEARMEGFLRAGVTRISFGAQTFDQAQLRQLERIHTVERIGEAVREARAAGLGNVSLDLMFWLPGQSKTSWLESVDKAVALSPDHLSLYLLELYPNAPLREAIQRRANGVQSDNAGWTQAADDEAADMYLEALERLEAAGYGQYEISNVARPHRESRHNLKYWTGGSWRGFGCGAHTTIGGARWHNVASTTDYIDRISDRVPVASGLHTLSERERIQEALFTGLRLTRGVDCAAFAVRYGVDPWKEYGAALSDPVDAGLVWRTPAAFGLTRSGMLMANEVLTTFV
ncbi:MAG: radical SAM family heme chaperone HemW [Acidobacteriota bacterium]